MNQDDKKAFRKAMLARRDAIPYENRIEADKARNERIRNWEIHRNAELLLFYVSYRSEADTLQLLKEALEAGRNVAVPKVVGNDMIFYRITEFSQLVEGYKGILEPDVSRTVAITEGADRAEAQDVMTESVNSDTKGGLPENTILFVPGCAFDDKGGRMGYGGGFYDRFMEAYPVVLRVALAYEEQLVDEVPREVHDKSVNVIVTEMQMLQIPKADENSRC